MGAKRGRGRSSVLRETYSSSCSFWVSVATTARYVFSSQHVATYIEVESKSISSARWCFSRLSLT